MSDSLRILELIYSFDIEAGGGGITRFVTELAPRLDSDHFKVFICALGEYGTEYEKDRLDYFDSHGVQAFTAAKWDVSRPYHSFSKAYGFLKSEVEKCNIDIVHSHSEFSDVIALILKVQHKIPVIVRTIHNGHWLEWRKRPLRRFLFSNFLYPISYDAEIGISPPIQERLNRRAVAHLMKKKAYQINNGVDVNRFSQGKFKRAKSRENLGIPSSAFVIGSIGRLTEEKGYNNLIDAFAKMARGKPNAFLLIVGSGPLEFDKNTSGIGRNFIQMHFPRFAQ